MWHMVVKTSSVFDQWLEDLQDPIAVATVTKRLDMLRAYGHLGDHKHIAGSIFEMRIHTGPGYRLYVAKRGDTLVILLCGGDKSTQKRDIQRAQEVLKEFAW
ncbi:type II toxin-antitoxin system RelE/ParE family toxin [Helicobacter salomonis]|uniref:type II toxin-antitoxin system RelE/ParE family toxin n=1 Tax=Helicobacter salomonis TaxID=56878 RepID=UPI002D783373|nr:type II toxin-antitoxin system RelE/ParE family toxin [Helicobacter salomonis]